MVIEDYYKAKKKPIISQPDDPQQIKERPKD